MREVVITGLGLVTPLGIGIQENWKRLKAMKAGIGHYPRENTANCFQYLGKIPELAISDQIPLALASQIRFLNRGALLGMASAQEAIAPSRERISYVPPGRRALYIGSGDFTKAGCDFMHPAIEDATRGTWQQMDYETLNQATMNKVNPFFLLESISNNLFSFLSALLGFMGPNTSLASLSPYGSQALELAYRSVKQERADVALAVGCGNWITDIPLYELEGLGLLSKCRDGAGSFRPFDRTRDGFIPGEGGAAVLLESLETARRSGAAILGKIEGVGNAIEVPSRKAFGISPKIYHRSISMAAEECGYGLKDVAFISAHGSATQRGDRSELLSLLDLMASERANIPLCGLKPYTGHMGAASDLAEIILGIRALRNGFVPATLNFRQADKEFSSMKISNQSQPCDKELFLSLSCGIGGQSSCVMLSLL